MHHTGRRGSQEDYELTNENEDDDEQDREDEFSGYALPGPPQMKTYSASAYQVSRLQVVHLFSLAPMCLSGNFFFP